MAGQRLIANFSTSQEPLEADQGEKCCIMLNMYLDSIRFTIIFTKKPKFNQYLNKERVFSKNFIFFLNFYKIYSRQDVLGGIYRTCGYNRGHL